MPKWRDPQMRGIVKKGRHYWYRRELKPELREKLGKRNIMVPLHTTDLAIAIKRADDVRQQIDEELNPKSIVVPVRTLRDKVRANLDRLDDWAMEYAKNYDTRPLHEMSENDREIHGMFEADIAEELERMVGFDQAKRFHDIATRKRTPMEALLERYAKSENATPGNLRDKRYAIKRSGLKFMEDVPNKRAAAEIADRLLDDPDLSRTSVNAIIRNLRALFGYAERRGDIEYNPFTRLRVGADATEKRALTREELQLILEQTKGNAKQRETADILLLLCFTGLRVGELLQLTPELVKGRWLEIPKTKNKKPHRVPFPEACRPIVERLSEQPRFIMIQYDGLWKRIREVYAAALGDKASEVDLHSTRRLFLTACEHVGLPEATAAALANHAHPNISYGRYSAGLDDKRYEEAIEQVAAWLLGA